MGTTLQNGVYLPNEGERNCYAGLKTNWEILDQKVADVTALQQAVAGALHREIVESLPTTDIDPNTIYMILSGTSATENVYNEYMYVNNAWELIGTSATDLTNYYTKAEVDGKLLLKANDSDVVHKSGDETVGGIKTFDSNTYIYNSDTNATTPNLYLRSSKIEISSQGNTSGDQNLIYLDKNNTTYAFVKGAIQSNGSVVKIRAIAKDSSNNSVVNELQLLASANGRKIILPTNPDETDLGSSFYQWKSVYATNYYYGSNNVEFSTKFVTTDTNQTISGSKTFSDSLTIYNSDDTATPKGLAIRNAQWGIGESGGTTVSSIRFLDKNSSVPVSINASKGLSGQSYLRFAVRTKDSQNNTLSEEIYYDIDTSGNVEFRSWHDNIISLGISLYRWKDVQTYKINNLEPSSLGMPDSDPTHAIDISSYISDLSGGINTYIAPANGYITFSVTGTNIEILSDSGLLYKQKVGSGQTNKGYRPCYKNENLKIYVTASAVFGFKFIPCQGNV